MRLIWQIIGKALAFHAGNVKRSNKGMRIDIINQAF